MPAQRVRSAIESGLTIGQLRSSGYLQPFWGIRTSEPMPPELAFAPRLGASAFFFGISAARIHGLPLPRTPPLPVHVGVPAGVRRPRARDVAAHHVRIAPRDVTRIGGVAVTSIERTWCDLAAIGLELAQLVAAGDAILQVRHPRSTLQRIRAAAARYEGRRGTRTIAAALPMLDGRAESAPESEIRVALITAGVSAPEVGFPIRIAGALVHVDLAWPARRVAIEYEGDHHRTERSQWHYDIRRYDALADLGWTVVRATAADYRDPRRLIDRVQRAAS